MRLLGGYGGQPFAFAQPTSRLIHDASLAEANIRQMAGHTMKVVHVMSGSNNGLYQAGLSLSSNSDNSPQGTR